MAYSGSAADRLTSVRAAMEAVMSGAQEIETNGRVVKLPSLETLRKLEISLQEEVNQENAGGSMCSVGMQVQVR